MGRSYNIPQLNESDGIPQRACRKINEGLATLMQNGTSQALRSSANTISVASSILDARILELENRVSRLEELIKGQTE